MVNGLFTASRGMMNILAKQDLMANNLSNANTTGFKISQLATRSEITVGRNDERKMHQDEDQDLNEVYTQFTQGPMVQTDHPLDLAVSGPGFFNIKTSEGIAYSRNGGFSLNIDKQIVTLDGRPVLDDGGQPIKADGDALSIQADGGVFVDGQQIAKLAVTEFSDQRQLLAKGDGLYRNLNPQQNPPRAAGATEIRQGFLEASNVDTVGAMVSMIAIHRNYEADQRVLQSIDQTLSKAVNEVGKV